MSPVGYEGLQSESTFSESEKQRIRVHLEEVLASQPFSGSRRRQAFLKYVVEESLAGRGSAIKEANIAVDVFGRSRDFEANGGSIVRVTGGDVRKCLSQAYASGLGEDIRIELPLGGYHPTFQFPSQTDLAPQEDAPVATPAQSSIKWRGKALGRTWIAALAGLVLLAGASVLLARSFRQPVPALEQMWKPFFDKDRPVLISLGTPTLLMFDRLHQSRYLPLDPSKSIPASDLILLKESYVGTGGAMAAARFGEQLTTHKQKFDLKFGSDVNFADLKNSPSLLIGVSRLTQHLTEHSRFQLKVTDEGIKIVDMKQTDRAWARPRRTFASPPRTDGYSMVTRILHSDAGHPILMVAGMDSNNTQAAVEFLTNNEEFRRFSDSAPKGWAEKNFQVVLHNSIYGNSAGSLQIVASDVE